MGNFKNDSKAKRYYWLQLKTDFFDQKEIKLLRKIAGGDTFTIIYLKMLLASLKDEGKLYFEAIGDNFSEEIALLLDEDTENVSITLKFLESKGLIEVIESDEYFLNKVPEMVGSESYSAERMRRLRAKKTLQSDTLASQSDIDVTKRRDREELEIEKSNSSREEESLKPIFTFWEQNGFGTIPPKTVQDFDYWIKDFEKIGATTTAAIELILHALGIAVDNGVKKYAYVNKILTDWEQYRYLAVDQVKAEDKKNSSSNNKRQWPDYSVGKKLENSGSSEYDNLGW